MNNEEIDEALLNENQLNTENDRIGFGRRFGAYMLDFLVIIILGAIVASLVGDELVLLFFEDQLEQFEELSYQFEDMDIDVMAYLYKTLNASAGMSMITVLMFILEGALGQSVGKMILKIVNTNVDGSVANPLTLWLRSLLKYGSTLLSLLGGLVGVAFLGTLGSLWGFTIFVGFFFVFGDNKQTLHDIIAKTVVSKK